jgi:pimeloyl-ACP methyl ester carboxylesterase
MIDARHFVHLESPGPFNAAVRDFLEQIETTSP